MEQVQGNVGQVNIPLAGEERISCAARSIATIIATPKIPGGSVSLDIGEGAGVHFILHGVLASCELVVEVKAQAQFTLSVLGCLTAKHTLNVRVKTVGEGANVHVQTALVCSAGAEVELRYALEHASPRTFGRMVMRRIQHGKSTSTFKGMLKVGKGAHGTDTYLSDKVVLMGEGSKATSDPQLEILANDVKASHGATIGQLSAEELFYLRARGLDTVTAESLLLQSFLKPALIGVPLELQQQYLNPNF